MSLFLHGTVQPQGITAIEYLVSRGLIRSANVYAETASTNSAALDEIRQGLVADDALPKLYFADRQTAGRGRHGRTWLSQADSLTFSLAIRRTTGDSSTLGSSTLGPIAVGVAIARALEFCFAPLHAQLKWPNDVYLGGGKVAGILLETTHTTPETVVIGVGVNTNEAPSQEDLSKTPAQTQTPAPVQARAQAQAIARLIGREVNRYELLPVLMEQVIEAIDQVRNEPQEIVDDYRARCLLSGNAVTYQQRGTAQVATCRGINPSGELMLETAGVAQACSTGEVNLVRVKR